MFRRRIVLESSVTDEMKRPHCFVLFIILFLAHLPADASFTSVFRTSDGAVITLEELSQELKGTDIVFIGEQHDRFHHHQLQLAVIHGLHIAGVPLSVGFEMFRAKDQDQLTRWVEGRIDEETFRNIYSGFWSMPWTLYEDIFLYVQDHEIPMIGLNIPESIGRKISSSGFDSLNAEEMKELPPDITCDDISQRYRDSIRQAYDRHHWTSGGFEYFCEAQMIWDKSMAWHLVEYMNRHQGRTAVVLAGIAHAWKPGIPEQVVRASNYTVTVILPEVPGQIDSDRITVLEADYILR